MFLILKNKKHNIVYGCQTHFLCFLFWKMGTILKNTSQTNPYKIEKTHLENATLKPI